MLFLRANIERLCAAEGWIDFSNFESDSLLKISKLNFLFLVDTKHNEELANRDRVNKSTKKNNLPLKYTQYNVGYLKYWGEEDPDKYIMR
jgi:hypothetical protein